jgi:hypothetical protein
MNKLFENLKSKDIPVPEMIKDFFYNFYGRIIKNPNLGKLILDESNRLTRGLNDEILDFLLLIYNFFNEILIRGIKEGSIRDDIQPEIMAATIMGASNSVVLRGYLNLDNLEDICQRAPEALYRILLEGIFILGT